MIMISFRTKREREEMLEKAKKMERFASEFVDCLENSEEEYEYDYREEDDIRHRNSNMRNNRYSYK